MLYLIITIVLNCVIAIIFKGFKKYKINTLQAIVFNYWVCVVTGCLIINKIPIKLVSFNQPWFPFAVLLGIGFFTIFNTIGYCTNRYGITPTTVANKMSLVIPFILSIYLYKEPLLWWHILAIMLAIPAIMLAISKPSIVNKNHSDFKMILLTIFLFVGSGLLDTAMKYAESNYLPSAASQANFSIHIFAIAGIIGLITIILLHSMNLQKIRLRNVFAGIILGIPNYFSIYYLLRMLNSRFLPSAALIPICNISILVGSVLVGRFIFKETLSKKNIYGIALGCIVILLLTII